MKLPSADILLEDPESVRLDGWTRHAGLDGSHSFLISRHGDSWVVSLSDDGGHIDLKRKLSEAASSKDPENTCARLEVSASSYNPETLKKFASERYIRFINGRFFETIDGVVVSYWNRIQEALPVAARSTIQIAEKLGFQPSNISVEYWVGDGTAIDERLRKEWDDGRNEDRSLLVPWLRVGSFIDSLSQVGMVNDGDQYTFAELADEGMLRGLCGYEYLIESPDNSSDYPAMDPRDLSRIARTYVNGYEEYPEGRRELSKAAIRLYAKVLSRAIPRDGERYRDPSGNYTTFENAVKAYAES